MTKVTWNFHCTFVFLFLCLQTSFIITSVRYIIFFFFDTQTEPSLQLFRPGTKIKSWPIFMNCKLVNIKTIQYLIVNKTILECRYLFFYKIFIFKKKKF
jgi:hypothetical protein